MKIAFTAQGSHWEAPMDPRFGRTPYIVIYDEDADELTVIDNRAVENEAHGAGPLTARKVLEAKPNIVITGNGPGGNAAAVVATADITIYVGAGAMTVKEAYAAYKDGKLAKA